MLHQILLKMNTIFADLAGKDDWEAAIVDSYADGVQDAIENVKPLLRGILIGLGNKAQR